MTRETKVSLLVGLCIILLIAILVSDHLTQLKQGDTPKLGEIATHTQEHLRTPGTLDAPRLIPPPRPNMGITINGDPPEPSRYSINQRGEGQGQAPLESNVPIEPEIPGPAGQSDHGTQPGQIARNGDGSHEQLGQRFERLLDDVTPIPVMHTDRNKLYHIVDADDTLFALAERYLGNGDEWPRIQRANPHTVTPDGMVRQGVKLLIPTTGEDDSRRRTRTAQPPTVPAQTTRWVVVESGQTLSELAKTHLGSAGRWRELLKANSDQLEDELSLRPGMKLRIPSQSTRQPRPSQAARQPTTALAGMPGSPSSSNPRSTSPSSSRQQFYVVRSRDTLSSIASVTLGDKSKWDRIYQANRGVLKNPNVLKVGTKLRIP